jgi:SMODS-associated NUDIX domain
MRTPSHGAQARFTGGLSLPNVIVLSWLARLDHLLWALVFAVVAAPFGHWTFTNRHNLMLSARCSLFLRRCRIRVSCACLLRIVDESGQYLLAQTRLRRETFGPFGGAFKYFENARAHFDRFGFEPQVMNQMNGPGIKHDLRGFLWGSSVASFMRWFRRGTERESDSECLKRELQEELAEVALPELVPTVEGLEFAFVREVIEPPVCVEHTGYWQMRIFRVYDLDTSSPSGILLREQLLRKAEANEWLMLASADQVRYGRVRYENGSRMIGHQTGYLFSDRRVRPNEPDF